MQEGAEQQHQHRIDHHQAGAHRLPKAAEDLGHDLGIAEFLDFNPRGRFCAEGTAFTDLERIAERRVADEVGAHQDPAAPVVTVDRGRPLAHAERRQPRRVAPLPASASALSVPRESTVGTRSLVELHPDRNLPIIELDACEIGADVADGRNAHSFRDLIR